MDEEECCDTCREDFAPIFVALHAGVVLTALVANGLVLAAIAARRNLRSPNHALIGCLAGWDILTALSAPFYVSFYLAAPYRCRPVPCLIRTALAVLPSIGALLLTCALALDRYLAIAHPLRYSGLVTNRRVFAFVFISTVYLAGVFCMTVLLRTPAEGEVPCDALTALGRPGALLLVCGHVTLTIVITSVLYGRIFLLLRGLQLQPRMDSTGDLVTVVPPQETVANTVLMVLGVRLFVLFPFLLLVMLNYLHTEFNPPHLAFVDKVATLLFFSKTVTSPLITGFRNVEFRSTFRSMFLRVRHGTVVYGISRVEHRNSSTSA